MISKKYLKKPLKPIQLWVAMKKGSFAEKFWIIIIPLFDAVTQNPQTKKKWTQTKSSNQRIIKHDIMLDLSQKMFNITSSAILVKHNFRFIFIHNATSNL